MNCRPFTGCGGFRSVICLLVLPVVLIGSVPARGQEATGTPPELPKPRTSGGRPFMEVLRDRRSTREYASRLVPAQVLSDLLWSGFGVNRADGHRTAPSTMNLRSIDIYVCLEEGAYRYEATNHTLVAVVPADVRLKISAQEGVKDAPVHLLFVADHARMAKVAPAEREAYAWADAGLISENLYLFCASEGLGTVVHALGDKAAIAAALHLRPDQSPVLGQAVGYPKTAAP
jgi:nitroreductase